MKKNIHVAFLKKTNTWVVKSPHSQKAISLHTTKEKAVKAGTKIVKKWECEIFIHRHDGKISERNTFGHDPFPPKG